MFAVNQIKRMMDTDRTNTAIPENFTPTFLDPTVDWAFKYIFSHEEVLRKLLNDLLPVQVGAIEYLPNEIPVLSEKDKRSIFDVVCMNRQTGKRFIVEMQSNNDMDMDDRLFFYGASLVHRQIERGNPDYSLAPVYVVCLANYPRKHADAPEDKILFRYGFREEETHEPYGNQLTICRLELLRLGKQAERCRGNVEKWAYYLKNMPTFVTKPAGADEEFDAFFDVARFAELPETDKQQYYKAMKSEYEIRVTTQYSYNEGMEIGMERGRVEGRAEGRTEGRAEGRAETARAMLADGVDPVRITKYTGLSAEELEALKVLK